MRRSSSLLANVLASGAEDPSRDRGEGRPAEREKPKHWRAGGGMKANDDTLLTPAEVAALFRVDPKTVTRWAKAGKLSSIRTLGGHRRYRADEVRKFLDGGMPGEERVETAT